MRLEDEFDGITQGAFAASVRGYVVRFLPHFGTGIFDGDGQASGSHSREVDDIIANEGGFLKLDSFFFNDVFEGGALILNALANVFELEIASAEGNRLRDAFRDQAGLDAGETSERDRSPIMRMEAFGFDQALYLAGAGKMKSLPSVRTPSTSKRRSLILRARAWADSLAIAGILAAFTDSQWSGTGTDSFPFSKGW